MNNLELENFSYKWKLWYHYEKDNWNISAYKHIYTISNPNNFWKLYNNLDKIGGITSNHFFLIREDTIPLWEDEKNINGGSWSFKIYEDNVDDIWLDLSIYLLCDILCPTISDEIMGLSISPKKNNYYIIKIWNNNSEHNSLKLINDKLLLKWGIDIIYISHISN